MKALTIVDGVVAPMDRSNVDTDMIIPKQFLKSIKRSGFGPNLFDELRYLDEGHPGMDNSQRPLNMEFPLNQPRYQGASILLSRENFGCGSSREHAPWALEDYGFRVVIASSFADIFYNNCFKNGLLPIVVDEAQIAQWFKQMYAHEGFSLRVDLPNQKIIDGQGNEVTFEVDAFRKHCLVNGLDDIGLTLQDADKIKVYEEQRASIHPWVFGQIK
ncbi:MAG: 3-isopropylmalate dehydratase small subunit [Reinekea sp.]|jgi:3-isopropylmalate/(R)-2-methylmalate dehydratase small subunit